MWLLFLLVDNYILFFSVFHFYIHTGAIKPGENEPVVVVVVASKETKDEYAVRLKDAAEKLKIQEDAMKEGNEEAQENSKKGKAGKKGKKGKGGKSGEDELVTEEQLAFDPGSVVMVYEVWPRDPTFVSVATMSCDTTITGVEVSRGSQYISFTSGNDGTVNVYELPERPKELNLSSADAVSSL